MIDKHTIKLYFDIVYYSLSTRRIEKYTCK